MKTIVFPLVLLAIAIFSCTTINPNCQEEAFVLLRRHSMELKKKRGLQMIGIGGSTADDLQVISGVYEVKKKVDLEEARILFIEAAQGYRDLINADKQIRPYLHDYPTGPKNLDFSIMFFDETKSFPGDGHIAGVGSVRADVCYYVYDANSPIKLREYYREPYEEAFRIVQEEEGYCQKGEERLRCSSIRVK